MKPSTRRILDLLRRHYPAYALGVASLVGTNALNLAIPWLLKIAFDGLHEGKGTRFVLEVALGIALVAAVRGVVRTWSRLLILGGSRKVVTEMREEVFARLQALPIEFFDRLTTGEIVSRVINDLVHVRADSFARHEMRILRLIEEGRQLTYHAVFAALDRWSRNLTFADFLSDLSRPEAE